MEKDKLKKGIEQIKNLSMTTDEKAKMLHNLSIYVDSKTPVKSPMSILSYFLPTQRKLSVVVAGALIIILSGGSLAFASEISLPGDLLYPIKTKILEPVKIAIARNSESKAMIETKLANKRLEEAEKLERIGRLTPERKKYLDESFESHVSKFNKIKKDIEKIEKPENRKTEKIQKDFDEKLNSHNETLRKFDRDTKGAKRIEKRSDD